MSQKGEVEGINSQLSNLQLNGTTIGEELEAVAQKYKKALHEIKESYEKLLVKYKAMEKATTADALSLDHKEESSAIRGYVFVLVDAHSSKFDSSLLRAGEDGGADAANALKSAVSDHIQQCQPENIACDIIVRVYANFDILAAEVNSAGDTKADKMKIVSAFAQGFSSTHSLFDFINIAPMSKRINKVYDVLSWHLADPQCKQIFIGVSLSINSALLQQSKSGGRVTFIREQSLDSVPEGMSFQTIAPPPFAFHTREHSDVRDSPTGIDLEAGSRRIPQNGSLYGYFENNRYIAHTPRKADLNSLTPPTSLGSSISSPVVPSLEENPRLVPINASGHRIDPVLRVPTAAEQSAFKKRDNRQHLCSGFFLKNSCQVKHCPYDHSKITAPIQHTLKHRVKEWPCRFKGACRLSSCIHGHVCVKQACTASKRRGCRFAPEAHGVDMEVTEWVKPRGGGASIADAKRVIAKARNMETNSPKGSMENWPPMVGNLIDI